MTEWEYHPAPDIDQGIDQQGSIVGREIIGASIDDVQETGRIMRAMLKEDGPAPTGRWADLALLEPVRPYKSRHASTLLVFEAIDKAVQVYRAGAAQAMSRT